MTKEEFEVLKNECRERSVRGKYSFVTSIVGGWATITVNISDQSLLMNSNCKKTRDIYGGYHLVNAFKSFDKFEREIEYPELQVSPNRYDPNGLVFS